MRILNENKYRLQSNNKHLLSILDENYYLELGTVDLGLLNRLLSGHELELNELIYPPITLEGVGVISNFDGVEEIDFQLMYLEHLRRKQASNKFFLTCGILNFTDSVGLETYAPLVLIPIDIYFDKRKVSLANEPFINLLLLKQILGETEYQIYQNTRLTSVYQIDRFCQELASNNHFQYGVENYLTYARVEYPDFNLKKDFFSVERSFLETDAFTIFSNFYQTVKTILPTNMEQKYAILRYASGENFVVDGRLGSGKTYTALNIMADAINKNKHVLFISNDLDRISDVSHYFKTLSLENYIYNLSHYQLKYQDIEVFLPQLSNESFDLKFAKIFKDYENLLANKIHGFSIQSILLQLVELKASNNTIIPIEVEELLEVHEVESVYKKLQEVEKALHNIDPMAQNCWEGVENYFDESHVSEIEHSAKDFYNAQVEIKNYLEKLCNKYHLAIPKNIRDSHRLLQDLKFFSKMTPPLCWADSFKLEDAHQTLVALSIYIDKVAELNIKYRNLVLSNYHNGMAKSWINEIQYTHLNRNNDDIINLLFQTIPQISDLLERTTQHSKQIHSLNNQLCLIFDLRELDTTAYKLINELTNLYENHNIQTEWIRNIVQFSNEMTSFSSKFNNYYSLFYQYSDKLKPYFIKEDALTFNNLSTLVQGRYFEKNIKKYLNKDALHATKRNIEDIYQDVTKYVDAGNHLNEMVGNGILFNNVPSELQWNDYKAVLELYWQLNGIEQKRLRSIWQKIHLSKNSNPETTISIFKSFLDEGFYFDGIIEHLKVYKIIVAGNNLVDKVHNLEEWLAYLKGFLSLETKIKQLLVKKDVVITKELLDELVYMDNERRTIDEIVVSRNEKYRELLGELYQGFETDCNGAIKLLSYFEDFSNRINEEGNLNELLKKKTINSLANEYYTFDKLYETWYSQYRRFSRFFRGGLGFFMECSFTQSIRYINEYVDKVNQLPDVIKIIQILKDFQKIYLHNLCEGIRNSSYQEGISIRFLYSILEKYYQIFLKKNKNMITPQNILDSFEQYTLLERDFCTENIMNLQRNAKLLDKKNRIRPTNIAFNNYNELVDFYFPSRLIYLADLNIFNSMLDISKFDLVIIDDAHLTSTNKYYRLFESNQVIVFGDSNFQTSVSNTLMIRVPQSAVINYRQRYLPMGSYFNNPWSALNQYLDVNKTIPKLVPVSSINDFCYLVVDHFLKNPNHVINVAIDSYITHRAIYSGIIRCLQETISCASIIEILNYNIRVVNVSEEDSRYVNDVFIYYDDLKKYDYVRRELLFKNFTIVKDTTNIVYQIANTKEENAEIEKEIRQLVGKNYNTGRDVNIVSQLIVKKLVDLGYNATQGFGLFEFIIQDKKNIHAFIIDGIHNVEEFSILDRYKYYYDEYLRFGWNVHFIFLTELHSDFNATIEKIKTIVGDHNV